MTRRHVLGRLVGWAVALGGALSPLTRLSAPSLRAADRWTSWALEGLPAMPRTRTRFVWYRRPQSVGFLGWIEDSAGRVVGWVTMRGQTMLDESARRWGWRSLSDREAAHIARRLREVGPQAGRSSAWSAMGVRATLGPRVASQQ